jgi:hypothetical protein
VLDPQRERGRRLAGELFDADLGAANTIQIPLSGIGVALI